jgi:hypothetical protein
VLVAAMIGCGLVGFVIERAAYRPVRRSSRLAALITAIGVSLLLENGGALLFGADPKFFPQIVAAQNIALGGGGHDLESADHHPAGVAGPDGGAAGSSCSTPGSARRCARSRTVTPRRR